MKEEKLKLEQKKKRIKELDQLIATAFENHVLGDMEKERYLALTAKYEKEQQEAKEYVARAEMEVQMAKQESADLNIFLNAIRRCTDLTELTPSLVNTLIKKIEVFNSEVGADGVKHVPIKVHFRSVDIVTVPDEEEIIAAMEEIRNNPTKVA